MTPLPERTEQLVAALSRQVPSVSRHTVPRRIALGILAGGGVTLAGVLALLGWRADLVSAVQGFSFWMKLLYSLSIATGAALAAGHLARPTAQSARGLWLLAIPVLLLAGIGIGQLAGTPVSQWQAMWLGHSWTACPWLILGFALPIFAGLLWSFRKLAPARLRMAGAMAGLCAGGWAATLYCLHCPEATAVFVLTWYTLGMLLAAAGGALLGPRLLRW
jgi:hypothetical protein